MRNAATRVNATLRSAREILQERLPGGWCVEIPATAPAPREPEARLEVRGPDGSAADLLIAVRREFSPRQVEDLRAAREPAEERAGGFVVVAPYLGPRTRQLLLEAGIGYVDLTGNIRISLSRPGLFLDAHGADADPNPRPRPSRSLRGSKAGRIVRALVDRKKAPGVRELAEITGTDPGYVSRILSLLDREALVDRERGRVVRLDWAGLLERWARDAPISSRGDLTSWLAPRGLDAVTARLPELRFDYALSGTWAVSAFAPVAPLRLGLLYVADADAAARELDLRVAERGANVLLIEPADEWVFRGADTRDGLRSVAVSQAAADLLTSPGRGPAEAEALLGWMREHEEKWRG